MTTTGPVVVGVLPHVAREATAPEIYVWDDQMSYTLWYSNRCQYCASFCQMLAAHPELAAQFRFVDAARVADRQLSVPMLVVGQQAYVGRDAFAWLQQMTQDAGGPQCFDLSDSGGVEYTEIGGPATAPPRARRDGAN